LLRKFHGPPVVFLCRSLTLVTPRPSRLKPKPVAIPPLPPKQIFTPPKTPRHPEIIIPKQLLPANSEKANQFRHQALQILEQSDPLKTPQPPIEASHPVDRGLRRSDDVAHLIDIPGRDKFVIVDVNTRQFKVMKDDLIMVNKLKNADVGDTITFKKVLLLGTLDQTIIGRPYLSNIKVSATVEEQTKLAKVIVFKKKDESVTKNIKAIGIT